MFVGREKERIALTKYYKQEGSAVVVIYGREGIGKTTLLKEFLQDKPLYIIKQENYRGKNSIIILNRNKTN